MSNKGLVCFRGIYNNATRYAIGRKAKNWYHRIFFGMMDRTLANLLLYTTNAMTNSEVCLWLKVSVCRTMVYNDQFLQRNEENAKCVPTIKWNFLLIQKCCTCDVFLCYNFYKVASITLLSRRKLAFYNVMQLIL